MMVVRRRRWAVVAVVDVAARRRELLRELQRRVAAGNPFDSDLEPGELVQAVDLLNKHKGELGNE